MVDLNKGATVELVKALSDERGGGAERKYFRHCVTDVFDT